MSEHDFINWRQLSNVLTGNPDSIRSNRIPKKYKSAVQELKDLIEYFKKRNGKGY